MFRIVSLVALASLSASPVVAQEMPPADEPASAPMTTPGMTGPLSANPKPTSIDAGPLGEIYVTGAVSGIGLVQSRAVPGDKDARVDLSNGQVFIQKTDGPIQFFVQAGGYSLPALGTAYVEAEDVVGLTYGVVPQAFLKLVPSENFNVMVGKLPTLQGDEYTFTFENMNVNRGLLWNQENAVNRGVQANVSRGKLSASLSLNDGYYSNKYNWVSGSLAYALTPRDTVTVVAGANLGETRKSNFATPLLQNNSEVLHVIYTHNAGALTVTQHIQLTRVPRNASLGINRTAATYGAAVIAKYSFTPEFSVAGRAEYIDSKGGPNSNRPNLLYGPGSSAWSLTLTPTYQKGIFFARADLAYVKATDMTDGFGFGRDFDRSSQARGTLELGILF